MDYSSTMPGMRRLRGTYDQERGSVRNDDDKPKDLAENDISWWLLVLILLLAAMVIGLLIYFLLCRKVYRQTKSECFNDKVPTMADTPVRSTKARKGHPTSASSEYLQALMHDDDVATDVFNRSHVLYSPPPSTAKPAAE
eukprot:FR744398.1.p1 GENE.FR744398.1~~FR744398.1.p1  ORF type:complete len:140 (+),score=13.53 FR744398.1:108-527(+)